MENLIQETNRLKIYFAPLEGITGSIFRQIYEKNFGGIDVYYTPFVTTRDGGIMKKKEMKEILPENNKGIQVVPQIMTNRAEDFCQAAGQMAALGYHEVNLNLGCPSGTIVPKGKGAGFLRNPEALDEFLENIFDTCTVPVSVKSRIGFYEPEEFPRLLEIYNKYPLKRLILHLRTREEYYKNSVHVETFRYAMNYSKNPLCYNGDICKKEDLLFLQKEFPSLTSVMIGRGLLRHPGFTDDDPDRNTETSFAIEHQKWLKQISHFLADLEQAYMEVMSGDIPVLFKMKEIWTYLQESFPDGKKWFKKIKKAKSLREYDMILAEIF